MHLMMLQSLKLWSCTRSKAANGQFLKLLPLKEKVSLRVWTGKLDNNLQYTFAIRLEIRNYTSMLSSHLCIYKMHVHHTRTVFRFVLL